MHMKARLLAAVMGSLLAATAAQAATVTETYNFSLSNFVDIINNNPAPFPTVTGSFTVTFDPYVGVGDQTTGFTFTSTPILPSDSAIGFSVFAATSPNGDAKISVGGIENGSNFVSSFTNDPIVFFDIPDASKPANATLVVCSQPGFTCGNYTGNQTVYASGYALQDDRNSSGSIWFATTQSVSPVPEPSTWIMMIAGFIGLGYVGFRRARGRPIAA